MADITDTEEQQIVKGLASLCEDDEIVTRWIAFVEVIDQDGKRGVRASNSEGWLPSEINGVLWDAMHGEFDYDEDEEV